MRGRAVLQGLASLCLSVGLAAAVVNAADMAVAADDCAKCRAEHNACRTRLKSLDSSKCDAQLVKCLRNCKKR